LNIALVAFIFCLKNDSELELDMAGRKILCVAEKNSIAKAVAHHLGGNVRAVCVVIKARITLLID